MRQKIIPFLLAAIGSSASAVAWSETQSYYDYEGPTVRTAPIPPAAPAGRRKSFLVDGDAGSESVPPRTVGKGNHDGAAVTAGQGPRSSLPPNMDRGVHDLEAGMDDLRAYTAEMAAHVQQNGVRGFLAIPTDIRDQGIAVGRKIGGGINGIMTDAAQDMIVPEKR